MSHLKARRVLVIMLANIGVFVALLAVTESICRYLEYSTTRFQHSRPFKLPPKRSSELRVFAFGASTVWGEPVPEIGFVAQMQYWLPRLYPDRDVRVYNFGERGKNTFWVLKELTGRLDDQPDLIIVITGGNEFLSQTSEDEERTARMHDVLFSHFATMRLLDRGVRKLMKSRESEAMPCKLEPWDRESEAFQRKIAQFKRAMNLIIEGKKERDVKLIVCTTPSNLADWPPVHKRLTGRDQRYSNTVSRIREFIRSGKYEEASDAVTTAFVIYGEDSMMYFLRGQLQVAVGRYAEARLSFLKARDLDPFPWRATSQINAIIREAVSRAPGVYLVDLEKEYEKHSNNGLVGFDLIADNVHSTPQGESVTTQAIIKKMIEIGFLPNFPIEKTECCPIKTLLADVGYFEPKSPLRFRALLDTATFAMKAPFLNYEVARMYLDDAMQVDANSWKVWANLATLSYLTGDTRTGARELQRATELHHGPLDLNDRGDTPYLKEATEYPAGCTGVDEVSR